MAILIEVNLPVRLLISNAIIIGIVAGFGDKSLGRNETRAPRTENLIERAQEQFAEKNYRRSIGLYRRHLRSNRKDADAWSQLGVCYLYAGQPETALQYLRRWIKRTNLKAYNEYHQGLAYLATGYTDKAKIALTRAARFNDEFAARATYELLVTEYNATNFVRAQYWANLYKQRYPNGAYIREVTRIDQSLRNKSIIDGLKGNPKPDIEDALYKYHRLSLYPKPHYWFMQTGYDYTTGTSTDPGSDQAVTETPLSEHKLVVNAGVGLGPIERGGATSWIGYNYKQDWITDDSRYQTFSEALESGGVEDYLKYFPFRADLLERTHELYGDVRFPIDDEFFAGVYGRQDFKYIGSELIPGTDQLEIEQSRSDVSNSTTVIPSVGMNYYKNFQTLLYFYLRKEISKEAKEFSNQTYNFFGRGEPFGSFGISHRMAFPEYQVNVAAELFQYEYMFNDNWLDYTRTGFLIGGEYEFEQDFWVTGSFGMYTDEYKIEILKQKSCNFAEKRTNDPATAPKECSRIDEGTIYQIGAYWDFSQFARIAGQFRMVENSNRKLVVYESTKQTFIVTATWAFPSTQRVLRFIERFGDIAFSKNPGD